MSRKLLLMFSMVMVFIVLMIPCAFADGETPEPADPYISQQTVPAVTDGGEPTPTELVPTSEVKVEVDTPAPSLDEIVVEGISKSAAKDIIEGKAENEEVLAAAIVKAEDSADQELTDNKDITDSEKKNPYTVDVTAGPVDKEQYGISLFEIGEDGSIQSDRTSEITSITYSSDKTVIQYMTDSLYNFLLKTYGKYSSGADKTLTYTGGNEEERDPASGEVIKEAKNEQYKVSQSIGDSTTIEVIVTGAQIADVNPMNLSASFDTPADSYINGQLLNSSLQYSDYIAMCNVGMKLDDAKLTSLDSKYKTTIVVTTNKLNDGQELRIFKNGIIVEDDIFTVDASGDKLVLTKEVTDYKDIFNYLIVAENIVETNLTDKTVPEGGKPVKEGEVGGYTIEIVNTTTATKANVKSLEHNIKQAYFQK